MAAIVGLPLIIFAILFVLGIIEIIVGVAMVVINKIRGRNKGKIFYVIASLLVIIGLVSLLPMAATKLLIGKSIDSEKPEIKTDKTITISYKPKEIPSFNLDGRKYLALTEALEKHTGWKYINTFDGEEYLQEKLIKKPIAKVKRKESLSDKYQDEDFMGFIMTTFYGDNFSRDYLYKLKDPKSEILVVQGYDSLFFEYYVPEEKLDYYFNIFNYDFSYNNEDDSRTHIELSKETVNELQGNAKNLLDFNDENDSENIDYEKMIEEKDLEAAWEKDDSIINSLVAIEVNNEELGIYGTVADLYIINNKVYQVATVYTDEYKDGILMVRIELSPSSSSELLKKINLG